MISALKTVRKTWKFRLATALAARVAPLGTLATPAELDHLIDLQTAYWYQQPPLTGAAADQALRDLNARSSSVFIFEVRGKRVRIWDKPAFAFPAEQEALRKHEQRSFGVRALLYQAFFEAVLVRCQSLPAINFALDLADIPQVTADLPIFGFQKYKGANNLLLPDVDFFHAKWYRHDHDTLPYDDKTCSACFVGSSTGGSITVDSIDQLSVPRLRAAAYFQGSSNVFFRIANAVHCDSDQAKSLLMRQPYFCAPVEWNRQLQHRLIISMDGNGAACSRLVKGLRSNSAVVKFDSPYELYYFPALKPGCDHLVAETETDLQCIVAQELAKPGTFKPVALAGQQFAAKYLSIRSVMDYTARLLGAYGRLQG
ncbi:glycosyl transferase family 90 [Aquabacterium sp.]|uniref:glycosyl transferase family 90 n=1 Tax=Aquabacterium sp. TaxID=1872578 RepID=UPI0019BABD3D|nr:glycosyl transferase family 90 [Aquabacterium sp.]MBC7700056.1 hypothetical protein [Aquabacterium sp.]